MPNRFLVVLLVCAGSLFGSFSSNAWAQSAGCVAASNGTTFSYSGEFRKILVNQSFSAGDQFTIQFTSYTNGGGVATKTINVGQGDIFGNANTGGFASFSLSGPGTFGPYTVPGGGISRLSMSIAAGRGVMTAAGTITCVTPVVTSISPANGTTAGGTSVTITGTSFTGATSVTIGGVAATGVTVVNATTITATTPAHAAGAVDVAVTTPVGTGTGTGLYTYGQPPTVTAISPTNGPSTGGTSVTITGTNFTGATAVTIGGVAATGVTVVNATTITATMPAHAPGAADVVVTTPLGSGTGTGIYTFASAPTVTAISPTTGPSAGATAVTITGTNLTGATAVTIGGIAATGITVIDSTTLTATTPAHAAGAVDVVVTTPGGTGTGASLYRYADGPTVTAISPARGPVAGGTSVTITGTGLTGATAVTIGGTAATGITVVNATTITATTPAHAAGTVDIVITTSNGTGAGARLFTFAGKPTVTGISPTSGSIAGGTAVTITGTNFSGATRVTIGGAAATRVRVVNATTITAISAVHASGTVDIVVTAPGGTGTGSQLYTYLSALTLASTASSVTQVNQPYLQTNVGNGGTPGYTYTVSAGSLPAGTSLDDSTGVVSGTPTTSGAFSYTIKVTDSGATPQTATQVVAGTISPILTTVSLGSSVNPSQIGEATTFTAKVEPSSAAGTVVFMDGETTLCGAAALTSGVASCTASFATSGDHPITAAYGGSSAFAGSSSAVLVQMVNDQRVNTVEAIGTFISLRNDLIAANEPDSNRQIDRLMGADDATSSTSAANIADTSVDNDAVSDERRASTRVGLHNQHAASHNLNLVTGPVRVTGDLHGAMRFGLATSLSRMLRQGAGGETATARPRFDISIEGRYGRFRDGRASNGIEGHYGLVSIGADYVFSRKLLVGTMVQFDTMRQRSLLQTSDVSGRGWLAGPYATVRLTENMFWQGRAAWGRSTNDVSPFESYVDEFTTGRWLVSSRLTGHWSVGAWVLRPSMSVAHIEDAAGSYTDTFGAVIPQVTSRLGQARLGPEVGYRYRISPNVVLEPRAGMQVISNFAADTRAAGFGVINGRHMGLVRTRGRADFGLRVTTPGSFGLDVSGSYDGIGVTESSALAGQVMVRVPLK